MARSEAAQTQQARWQQIADKGLQDRFNPETRARFDKAVSLGFITLPDAGTETPDLGRGIADGPSESDFLAIDDRIANGEQETGSTLGRVTAQALKTGSTPENLVKGAIKMAGGPDLESVPLAPLAMDMFQFAPVSQAISKVIRGESFDSARELFPLTNAAMNLIEDNQVKAGSGEEIAGTAAALILDPINAAFGLATAGPKFARLVEMAGIKASPKAMKLAQVSAIGAATTGVQDVGLQLSHEDDVDFGRAVGMAAIGAATPYVFEGLLAMGRGVGAVGKKIGDSAPAQAYKADRASKMVEKVSVKAQEYMTKDGLAAQEGVRRALDDYGWGPEGYWKSLYSNGPKPKVKSLEEAFEVGVQKGTANAAARKAGQGPVKRTGEAVYKAAAKFSSKGYDTVRPVLSFMDNVAGRSVATRLEQIHPMLGAGFRRAHMNIAQAIGNDSRDVMRWRSAMRALPKNTHQQIKAALLSEDVPAAIQMMKAFDNHPGVIKAMELNVAKSQLHNVLPNTKAEALQGVGGLIGVRAPVTFSEDFVRHIQPKLAALGEDLIQSRPLGKGTNLIKNYFPRVIADREKFLKNTVRGRIIAKQQDDIFIKLERELGRKPTAAEASEELIKELSKVDIKVGIGRKARAENARQFKRIQADELPYYMDPEEALEAYIHNTREITGFRHFIGSGQKDNISKAARMLNHLYGQKRITLDERKEAMALIQSRIGNGPQQMQRWLANSKNLFYATTLANPGSALIQLGDTALSTILNGVKPTVQAIAKTIAHRNNLPDIDAARTFDLVRMNEELIQSKNVSGFMRDGLQRVMKLSGFTTIDKFGKNVNIQATLNVARDLAKGDNPVAALRAKFGNDLFTPAQWAEVAHDLQTAKISENIKFLTWNQLSNAQPISLAEVPQAYLDMPNGRIFYAMKSYMLKQLDLTRKYGFDLLAKPGRQVEGAQFLMKYAAFMGMSNMGVEELRNNLLGRELDPGDSRLDEVAWSALKGLGLSEYFYNDVKRAVESRNFEDIADAILSADALAHSVKLVGGAYKAFSPQEGKEDDPRRWKIINNFPVVGSLIYNYGFDGNTAFNEWAAEQTERELYDD